VSLLTRDQFIEYMEPTLRETFGLGFNYGNEWQKVWRIEESEKRREEMVEYVHPDVVVQTDEGSPYARLQVRKAYVSSTINLTFTGEVKISHEFIRDNMYREIEREVWGLGNAMQRKIYKDAVAQFYNGFSSVTSPDGLSLFNSAHTLKYNSAQTSSNQVTTSPALTTDSLNTAISLGLKTLDENGSVNPFFIGKSQLIVCADLRKYATEIARSPYLPDVANNAVNTFDIDVITLPLLAEASQAGYAFSATQWYLRDPMLARNYFFWREHPRTWMVNDLNSPSVLFQALTSYSFLIPTWRGLIGSKGQ